MLLKLKKQIATIKFKLSDFSELIPRHYGVSAIWQFFGFNTYFGFNPTTTRFADNAMSVSKPQVEIKRI